MFRRQRQFNIITGSVSPQPILQQAKSYQNKLSNFHQKTQKILSMTKLGIPKDKRQFQYAYTQSSQLRQYPLTQRKGKQIINNPVNTMQNYVSTCYNIINHMGQIQTARIASKNTFQHKLPQINKKNILAQHIHKGRLMAPNFHQDYQERTKKFEFFKKNNLCSNICDIQKTYHQGKYFRKLK